MSAELLLVAAAALAAGPTAAPLGVEMQRFERQAGDCEAMAGPCASFVADYPAFRGEPAAVVAKLAAEVIAWVGEADGGPPGLETAAAALFAGWREALAANPDAHGGLDWSDERSVSVLVNDGKVLSLDLVQSSFTGGAHPNSHRTLRSYLVADGRRLALGDFVAATAWETLTALGEAAFRREREIPPGDSLEAAGFWFERGFELNDNFAAVAEGLVFFYNPYEVGPYAIGGTEIVLGWDELAPLLLADAPRPKPRTLRPGGAATRVLPVN